MVLSLIINIDSSVICLIFLHNYCWFLLRHINKKCLVNFNAGHFFKIKMEIIKSAEEYYCFYSGSACLEGIARLSQQYDLRVANVFHAGDGNMHPLILFDANEPGEFARAEELGGKILELCVEVGGSISGEHGIGREKINQMCAQFNSDEITTFHAVKAAFDPDGLLNPGKNIPTLHRCAEFGAMHVHHGHLPFPELERF